MPLLSRRRGEASSIQVGRQKEGRMLSGACDLGSPLEGNIECEVLPLFLTPFLSSYLLHF